MPARSRTLKWLPFVLCLLYAVPAAKADETFVPKSIWGGEVRRVVEDPSRPGTFYAVSFGVYKSTDAGRTWERKAFPDAPQAILDANGWQVQSAHYPQSIAVNRNGVIIAADQQWSPLWRSTDGAETWQRVDLDADPYTNWKSAFVVSASLSDPDTFFASMRSFNVSDGSQGSEEIYVSTDAGLTWTKKDLPAPLAAGHMVTDIIQLPSGAVLVGALDERMGWGSGSYTKTGKLYYTANTGGAFSVVSSTPAMRFAWDPVNSRVWMLASTTELYSSSDGTTWTWETRFDADSLMDGGPNDSGYVMPMGVVFSSGTIPTMYAFTNNGMAYSDPSQYQNAVIYRSTDSANGFPASSWARVRIAVTNNSGKEYIGCRLNDLAFDSSDPSGDRWIAATEDEAVFYTGNGTSETPDLHSQAGIGNTPINYGLKRPGSSDIYAVTAQRNGRIYRSGDNGTTWTGIYPKTGEMATHVSYLAFEPSHPDRLYTVGQKYIKYTEDNGATFTEVANFNAGGNNLAPDPMGASNLLINPVNPEIMYFGRVTGTPDYQLLKSTDAGATWQFAGPNTYHGAAYLAMDPADPETLYIAAGDCAGYGMPANFPEGLCKSTDGGATWNAIPFFSGTAIYNIFTDADAPDAVLVNFRPVSGGSIGTAISRDKGATWEALKGGDNGQTFGGGYAFLVSTSVIGGSFTGALWRSDDLGVTPMQQVANLPTKITWVFKGSVYAASNMGLFNITNLRSVGNGSGSGNGGGGTGTYASGELKAYAFPNPFNPRNGSLSIRVGIPGAGSKTVKIRLYSLSGDVVLDADPFSETGGSSYAFTWDGRNAGGALCAPGLYFLVVDVDGTKVRHKIALVY